MAGTVSNDLKKLVEDKNTTEIKLHESKDHIEGLKAKNHEVKFFCY